MGNNDGQSSIKVVDKRRFDSDGTDKGSAESNQQHFNNSNSAVSADKIKSASNTSKDKEVSGSLNEAPYDVNFSAFVMGLATQVLALLGEIPSPENHQISINLDAAKETIDILCMIKEKTKGNLSDDESKLLDEVCYSLKMAFVKKVNEKQQG